MWWYWNCLPPSQFHFICHHIFPCKQTSVTLLNFFLKISTCRLRLKCDSTCTKTRFCLLAKRTSPFKSSGGGQFIRLLAGKLYTSACRVCIACASLVFCSHVMLTGYPLHSLVSPSLLCPCVTVCHHISNTAYFNFISCNYLPFHSQRENSVTCNT